MEEHVVCRICEKNFSLDRIEAHSILCKKKEEL